MLTNQFLVHLTFGKYKKWLKQFRVEEEMQYLSTNKDKIKKIKIKIKKSCKTY